MNEPASRPLVLCIAGHDPTGGAGIVADAEAVAAGGGHALTVISAHTVQDSRDVRRVSPVAPLLMEQQIELLLDDCRVGAIKIGLLGDPAQIPVIRRAIERAGVPVVFDPVLRAGGGSNLVGAQLLAAVLDQLLPAVTLATPNAAEARRLAPGAPDLSACAGRLLAAGCGQVLVTGGDEATADVRNTWYAPAAAPRTWAWPRLTETFHGAGCTLASAIAVRLAAGAAMDQAIEQGQRWTQAALARAFAVGQGRRIPGRHA